MTNWIKCSERLPEIGEDILIWVRWSIVPCVGWLNPYGEWMSNKDFVGCDGDCVVETDIIQSDVTHWMPLPPAPEEE